MFWTAEPIWLGETVLILAGGPSLSSVDLRRLRGRKVITINSSLNRAVDAGLDDGVLFFKDWDWAEPRLGVIARWRGLVVTTSRAAAEAIPRAKRVQPEIRGDFPRRGSPVIRNGRSSGHAGVGLAVALGASRIILLGYDMREVDGRTHHHDDYRQEGVDRYAALFIPSFRGWNETALKAGVEILNATSGSALKEFPMIDLAAVLA